MFGSNTFISKNACWPLTQNPLGFISTLASVLVLTVRYLNVSSVTGRSCGSTSTSFHTSVRRFAVKSRISLCLIVMKPPVSQFIVCWISILDLQLHVDGMIINLRPLHKQKKSQNCCLLTSYAWSLIGYDFNQFDTLFSCVMSFKPFDFHSVEFVIWSKLFYIVLLNLFLCLIWLTFVLLCWLNKFDIQP